MDYTYYLFALFVFLLLVCLVYLYTKLAKPRRRNDTAISEKERRLFMLYQNLDEMMNNMEAYVEASKEEITTQRQEITALLEKADSMIMQLNQQAGAVQLEMPIPRDETMMEFDRTKKQEMVTVLKGKGLNIEQIAQELEISCGEVLLILSIYKK